MNLQVDQFSRTQKETSFSGSQPDEEAVVLKILRELIT